MSAGSTDAPDMGSVLAVLWTKHRATNIDRISIVEETAAKIVRGTADRLELDAGVSAAHKLAGSLGTFGFEAGSRIALETEVLLREAEPDRRRLAEIVNELRQAVDETGESTQPSEQADDHRNPEADTVAPGDADVVLVSDDSDLAARLITAATGAGLTCQVVTNSASGFGDSSDDASGDGLTIPAASLVMIDAAGTNTEALVDTITNRLPPEMPVAVLIETDEFDQRLQLARAGVMAVIPRSQAPSIAMDFVAGTVLAHRTAPWRFLALGIESDLENVLVDKAVPAPGHTLECVEDPRSLWGSLEGATADVIALSTVGPDDSIPDLCRLIRADPGLSHVPIVAIGSLDQKPLQAAIDAGLDDVISPEMSAPERRARLWRVLDRTRNDRSGSGLDRLTGLESRGSVERSLDRLLRSSSRKGEPFAFIQLRVDGLDEIAGEAGAVISDLVLRRLSYAIKDSVESGAAIGRWSPNELVIGLGGADRAAAENRFTPIFDGLLGEQLISPSGRPVRCEFRWHSAASPVDGTTLASLERTCQIALSRGGDAVTNDRVDGFGSTPPRQVVDVVVVEDDDSVADVIAYALDLRGYKSKRFLDGEEAADALTNGRLMGRVILLDVGLPSLDGFGVLRRLASERGLESTHLIMLTARSSEAERLRALELGATEHMSKPFSVPVLLGRLDQVLAGGRP